MERENDCCFLLPCTNQLEVALVVALESSNGKTFPQIKTEKYMDDFEVANGV